MHRSKYNDLERSKIFATKFLGYNRTVPREKDLDVSVIVYKGYT